MFAGVAIVGLLAATRMIETRNLRLEEIDALLSVFHATATPAAPL
jgi:hypothetical protein